MAQLQAHTEQGGEVDCSHLSPTDLLNQLGDCQLTPWLSIIEKADRYLPPKTLELQN